MSNNSKLFVGNLSFNSTENDLQDAFAAHGTVVETNVVTDRATSRPRGFAFVTMGSDAEAQNAAAALNGKSIDSMATLRDLAGQLKGGAPVVLQIERSGQLQYLAFEME